MKNLTFIITILLSTILTAQNQSDNTDKMIDGMCLDFKQNENLNDSLKFESLNKKFILSYLAQFPDSERENKIDYLYFQFQKRCAHFRDYLQRTDPPKNDNWVRMNVRPTITVSENEMNQFKKNTDFYYFEYDGGEKTIVKTDKSFWKETFADRTSSKLYYKWISKNKFELEFIESNNNSRKNFSKKGDQYIYEIISKENNFYWVFVEVPDQSEMVKFKLFVGK